MSRFRMLFLVLFFATFLVPIAPAHATSTVLCTGYTSCAGKSYSSFGYSTAQKTSYWRMYTGTNCTNYIAYRLVTTNGMPNVRPASGVGNAQDWGKAMSSKTDVKPTVGSVAWWGKTGHHVAYVEKVVSSTEIVVSESNWSGSFDWRRITKTSSGWPDGFIHFADQTLGNSVAPSVTGQVKVGAAVKVSAGTWTPKGNTFTYQWLANGAAISGATAKTLTVPSTLRGKKLSVAVKASRPAYSSVKLTSRAIVVASGVMTTASSPVITGTPMVGSPISATSGSWSPAASSYTYQWSAGGVRVPGATSATYTPAGSDAGKTLTVMSTGVRSGYTARGATSTASAPVVAGTLTPISSPSVRGTPTVGLALTADPGTFSPAGSQPMFQWMRGGTAIAGATGATYIPTAADLGVALGVRVTAQLAGYTPYTVLSPSTAAVRAGTLVSTAKPTISGKARIGSRLTATPGRWSKPATFTYQWYVSGKAIPSATSSTYVPTKSTLGKRVRVRVAARRNGFTRANISSANTSNVTAGLIAYTSAPKISGKLSHGSLLKLTRGTITPSGASLRYQWLRDGKSIKGATGKTWRITNKDRGHKLSLRVTAKASGYTTLVSVTRARRASR